MVIEPQYYQVGNFSNGLCRFKERDFFTARWGFIDTTGKVVISQRFSEVADFNEDFAMFYENNKYGYADKTGKVIIEANMMLFYIKKIKKLFLVLVVLVKAWLVLTLMINMVL
jgi:hypothetical protein